MSVTHDPLNVRAPCPPPGWPDWPSAPCGHSWDHDPNSGYGLGPFAEQYAAIGFEVARLAEASKEPLWGSHGFSDATGDLAAVREAWARRPSANILLHTGQPAVPGRRSWVMLDLDIKRGDDGPGNFARFLAANGLAWPPGVPWQRTPSGGTHVPLALPPGVSVTSRNGILPGVDLKADRGYAVGAPSCVRYRSRKRPGEPSWEGLLGYRWAPGCCPCAMPVMPESWLAPLEKLRGTGHGGGAGRPGGPSGPLPPTEELIASGLVPGRRSYDMKRLALRLWREHGQDGGAAVEAVCQRVWLATPQGSEPFPWSEVSGRIAHARRYAAQLDAEDDAIIDGWLGRAS